MLLFCARHHASCLTGNGGWLTLVISTLSKKNADVQQGEDDYKDQASPQQHCARVTRSERTAPTSMQASQIETRDLTLAHRGSIHYTNTSVIILLSEV